jgi:hypothetical protein
VALRFVDSFDHYATAEFTRKYTSVNSTPSIQSGSGRNGGGCFVNGSSIPGTSVTSNLRKTLDAQASWVIGAAFYLDTFGTAAATILALLDAGTFQTYLRVNTDGTISWIRHSGVTLATSASALSTGTWHYIEWKVTIANSVSANTCKVRVNGVDWITLSAATDTQNTANATANAVMVGNDAALGHSMRIDDLYICDGTGSTNNDFLGDVMVTVLKPDGAGNSTQWTPSAGSNWQNVDEASVDSDTTYNSTSTAGHVDLYALENLSYTPASIKGIQWNAQVRKDDASTYDVRRVIRSGGTDYTGSTVLSPNTTYANYHEILETDPATSAAWTKSGIDALQAGVKLNAVT